MSSSVRTSIGLMGKIMATRFIAIMSITLAADQLLLEIYDRFGPVLIKYN